jgi:ubiquinone/menaquinone biosynthesis C-methylase UbiE
MTATDAAQTVDLEAVKQKQQGNWSAGNYAVIGTSLQLVGEELLETLDLPAGSSLLDVAAGNGNASLAAARRGCVVTAVDYVPTLIEQLKGRAGAEGLTVDARVGDAEALDVADGSYDAVTSIFGVMFTADQDRAAAELVRACRPGGTIALVNWTPDSFVGDIFRTIGAHVPPPAGVRSPMQWGTEERLQELFGADVAWLEVTRKAFVFRYRSAEELVDAFRTYYGPMVKAFESLDETGRGALHADLVALAERHNTSDTALRVPSTYVQVLAQRA